MSSPGTAFRFWMLAAATSTSLLSACDNSIEPFAESTRYYAIFGFLDADRDTQYVRIEPTRSNPEVGAVEFDVESVRTINLTTQETVIWSDSVVTLEEGGEGLLYYGIFRAVEGQSYRVEIERDDGSVTSASTTVPQVSNVVARRPSRSFIGILQQSLLIEGVQRSPERMVVNYGVTYGPLVDPIEVQVPYVFLGAPEGSGWTVIVRLTSDASTVAERLSLEPTDRIALHTLSVDLRLLSNDWPLEDPGLLESNVTNGFGFFGSAVSYRATWVLDRTYVIELGFIDRQVENGE